MKMSWSTVKEFLEEGYHTFRDASFFYVLFKIINRNRLGIDILKIVAIVIVVNKVWEYLDLKKHKNYMMRVLVEAGIRIPVIGVLVVLLFNLRDINIIVDVMKNIVMIYLLVLGVNYMEYNAYRRKLDPGE